MFLFAVCVILGAALVNGKLQPTTGAAPAGSFPGYAAGVVGSELTVAKVRKVHVTYTYTVDTTPASDPAIMLAATALCAPAGEVPGLIGPGTNGEPGIAIMPTRRIDAVETLTGTAVNAFAVMANGGAHKEGYAVELDFPANYFRARVVGDADLAMVGSPFDGLKVRTFMNGRQTGDETLDAVPTAAGDFQIAFTSDTCFDEVRIERNTQAAQTLDPATAFCLAELQYRPSDVDPAALSATAPPFKQCPRVVRFGDQTLTAEDGGSISVVFDGDVDVAEIVLAAGPVTGLSAGAGPTVRGEYRFLTTIRLDPTTGAPRLAGPNLNRPNEGESLSREWRFGTDATGHEFIEVPGSDFMFHSGMFRITALETSVAGVSGDATNPGARLDFSDKCDTGCNGRRFLKIRNQPGTGRRGFQIEHFAVAANGGLGPMGPFAQANPNTVANILPLNFQLASIDYSFPSDPTGSVAEVCANPAALATTFKSTAEFQECTGGEAVTYATGLFEDGFAAGHIGEAGACCARLAAGCILDVGSGEGPQHACLYEAIGVQAGNNRMLIQDQYAALGAQVGPQQALAAAYIGTQQGPQLAKAVQAYGDDIQAAIGLQAAQAEAEFRQVFKDLGVQLGVQSKLVRDELLAGLGTQGTQALGDFGAQVRDAFGTQAEGIQDLITWAVQGLEENAASSVQGAAAAAAGVTEALKNVDLVRETKQLLDDVPVEIEANLNAQVDRTEREVLLTLLQLKERLRIIDGARKRLLDLIKSILTANRIKLDRLNAYIHKLAHSSKSYSD